MSRLSHSVQLLKPGLFLQSASTHGSRNGTSQCLNWNQGSASLPSYSAGEKKGSCTCLPFTLCWIWCSFREKAYIPCWCL